MQQYSQAKAMLAITKGSLKSIFRSPSAVVFSFLFPLIFILVFGFINGGSSGPVFKIAVAKNSDTMNALYDSLKASPNVRIRYYDSEEQLRSDLVKGRITGILSIEKNKTDSIPPYLYSLSTTTASRDRYPQFLNYLQVLSGRLTTNYKRLPPYAILNSSAPVEVETVREYKTIDFILPGQLGFSLLSAGVFGVAFMFFNLRSTLVLKRFFATPIHRTNIVLGEALSRVLFQLITSIVILGIGHFFFGFTLVHGFITFLELLVLSFLGLVVFMGFGFIVSGLATSDSAIPPLANLITLPQFLLAGTFFDIEVFPKWLQPICNVLPLTHLNNAMRKVAFEGAHLNDCMKEIGILGLWGVFAYFLAIKVFKWE